MASVLMERHIRCRILSPVKTKRRVLLITETYLENIPSITTETAYLCCQKRKNTNSRFWCMSRPTIRYWFKSVPWKLAVPLRTRRTLSGLFGFITRWCGGYHSRSVTNVDHEARRILKDLSWCLPFLYLHIFRAALDRYLTFAPNI